MLKIHKILLNQKVKKKKLVSLIFEVLTMANKNDEEQLKQKLNEKKKILDTKEKSLSEKSRKLKEDMRNTRILRKKVNNMVYRWRHSKCGCFVFRAYCQS